MSRSGEGAAFSVDRGKFSNGLGGCLFVPRLRQRRRGGRSHRNSARGRPVVLLQSSMLESSLSMSRLKQQSTPVILVLLGLFTATANAQLPRAKLEGMWSDLPATAVGTF